MKFQLSETTLTFTTNITLYAQFGGRGGVVDIGKIVWSSVGPNAGNIIIPKDHATPIRILLRNPVEG